MEKIQLPQSFSSLILSNPKVYNKLYADLFDEMQSLCKQHHWNNILDGFNTNDNNKYLIQTALGKKITYFFNNLSALIKQNITGFLDTNAGIDFLYKYEKDNLLNEAKEEFKKMFNNYSPMYLYDYANPRSKAGAVSLILPSLDYGTINNKNEFVLSNVSNFYLWFETYYNTVLNNYLINLNDNFIKVWKSNILKTINEKNAKNPNILLSEVKWLNQFEEKSFYSDVFSLMINHFDYFIEEYLKNDEIKTYQKQELYKMEIEEKEKKMN